MPWNDRYIDVVIATHPDADHIGGLPHILERYGVGMYLEPGIESKNAIDDEIRRILEEKDIPRTLARRGMIIDFGDGAYFEVLYPGGDVSALADTNEASIVGQLRYASTTVMLTGDASHKIEDQLVSAYGEALRSDILKAGHHGSKTSSGERFVRNVAPRYAIISSGIKNRYGHPHKEVLEVFRNLGIQILGTYSEGTIIFESDGKSIKRK